MGWSLMLFRRVELCEWPELGGGWRTEREPSCCTRKGSVVYVCGWICRMEWRRSGTCSGIYWARVRGIESQVWEKMRKGDLKGVWNGQRLLFCVSEDPILRG
jgi:hypothetical protein